MFSRLRRLPFELRVALAAMVGVIILNVLWAASQFGAKIDPGLATLFGAIIGLAIVGHQARRGFYNLIRSQAHQAEIDREARVHQSGLAAVAKQADADNERQLLMAALRAEIVSLMDACQNARQNSWTMAILSKNLYANRSVNPATEIRLSSFDAPVFKANISRLGLLGVSLAADVIKVADKAKPGAVFPFSSPAPYSIAATIYAADVAAMNKWHTDLHQVALRIIAVESGGADPGTLIETQAKRYADLPSTADLVPKV